MKSEPEVYPIDQLAKDKTALWEGVRNYQARNFMTQSMSLGDLVLFYHSNAEPAGVAGIAKVSKLAEPDPTQFDKKSEYFDPKSPKDNPRWQCVTIEFVSKFKKFVSLEEIKKQKSLAKMVLLQKGSRLSIQPVTEKEFELIRKLGDG
jgi:predicted RNA-binding protein with PUA-like domain